MDALVKTIRKLTEEDYQALLEDVSPNKSSKPYLVLETVRNYDLSDSQMIEKLNVNPSTYYTLKSRLNSKIAAILSKKVDNPISVLLNEVTHVPAILYGTNKQVAIRVLKELEKQLLEYDLSNELIIVYKTLARLHTYTNEFDNYNRLYNKYVAFSLAASKAENLYYDFIYKAGIYELSKKEEDLELLQAVMREMANIIELYDSHRLYVLFSIMRIYYLCITAENSEALLTKELEIDETLQKIKGIFEKFHLDTMYNNFKPLIDFLYFIYYQRANHAVRAKHYYNKINTQVALLAEQHILSYHVIQFLKAKLEMFMQTNKLENLTDLNEVLLESMDVDINEVYHYISFQRFLAYTYFYSGDYAATARTLNNLRNNINLKPYWNTDADIRLLQALQYSIMGEEDLCLQITNSISRHIRDEKEEAKNLQTFIKFLKTTFKESETSKKEKKLKSLWKQFREENTGSGAIMKNLKIDDKIISKLAAN